jgi:hypothetical protein
VPKLHQGLADLERELPIVDYASHIPNTSRAKYVARSSSSSASPWRSDINAPRDGMSSGRVVVRVRLTSRRGASSSEFLLPLVLERVDYVRP